VRGSGRFVVLGCAVLAVVVVVVLSAAAGSAPYTALGNTDPGAVVRIGLPVLRLITEGAATLCVGALGYAVGICPRRADGRLSADGYRAVRAAGWWALLWLVAGLALTPLDVADNAGTPLGTVLAGGHFFGLLPALEDPRAWLVSAGVAAVVAIGCRSTLRWLPAVAVLVLAVFGLLPPLATGHSSSQAGHDLATAAIMAHVPAAALWLGALVALLPRLRRRDAELSVVRQRYARLAGVCWLVLAGSGLVDAAVLATPISGGYDLLLAVKIGLFAGLGGLGLAARRRVRRAAALLVAELVLLAATMALSVELAHLPPPAFVGRTATAQQTLLGYDLAGPPTALRLLLDWRPDLLLGLAAVLLAGWYLLAARRASVRPPLSRTLCWLAGCLVLLVASSSGLGRYAPAQFSVHLSTHMLLSMTAPLLLALGGPLELVRSPRLRAVADSAALRWLTQPIVALLLFAGAPFALYFTGLFDAAVRFHWAHQAIEWVFLAIGYLFAWSVVGTDPTPRPLPNLARLGMVLAAMPADVVFGALVIGSRTVIGDGPAGDNFYTALALPWVPNLLADQRLAGELALLISELSLFVALAALLLRWQRVDADDLAPTVLPVRPRAEPAQPQAVGHHEQ
jgi:cytochrome c oxidase assembly factor CtaG